MPTMDLTLLGRSLTEDERLKLEAIQPDGLEKVIVFPNADFRDPEDVPSGIVTVFRADAPVHADSIPERLFEHVVVIPVGSDADETNRHLQAFIRRGEMADQKALDDAVPQRAEQNPPRLSIMPPGKGGGDDTEVWHAELGSPEGFAGVMRKTVNQGRENHYYIVVRAGIPTATEQLRNWIQHTKPTFRQLVNSNQYGFTRDLARRNALRLAYNVAVACKLDVDRMFDIGSAVAHDDACPPLRAEPLGKDALEQPLSTVQDLLEPGTGKRLVAIYHGIRPREVAGNTVLVAAGPYHGVALFHTPNKCRKQWGYPATTGPGNVASAAGHIPTHSSRGLFWEAQGPHPHLQASAFASPAADEFLRGMRAVGWKHTGTNSYQFLIPVLVKLSSQK